MKNYLSVAAINTLIAIIVYGLLGRIIPSATLPLALCGLLTLIVGIVLFTAVFIESEDCNQSYWIPLLTTGAVFFAGSLLAIFNERTQVFTDPYSEVVASLAFVVLLGFFVFTLCLIGKQIVNLIEPIEINGNGKSSLNYGYLRSWERGKILSRIIAQAFIQAILFALVFLT